MGTWELEQGWKWGSCDRSLLIVATADWALHLTLIELSPAGPCSCHHPPPSCPARWKPTLVSQNYSSHNRQDGPFKIKVWSRRFPAQNHVGSLGPAGLQDLPSVPHWATSPFRSRLLLPVTPSAPAFLASLLLPWPARWALSTAPAAIPGALPSVYPLPGNRPHHIRTWFAPHSFKLMSNAPVWMRPTLTTIFIRLNPPSSFPLRLLFSLSP